MLNKSLFKQSCKANGTMWIIITVAVCFMLCCVMLIAGNGDLGNTKVAVEDTIVKEEVKAQTEGNSVTYFNVINGALKKFDAEFAAQKMQGKTDAEAFSEAYKVYMACVPAIVEENITKQKEEGKLEDADTDTAREKFTQEVNGIFNGVLNPQGMATDTFKAFYATNNAKYADPSVNLGTCVENTYIEIDLNDASNYPDYTTVLVSLGQENHDVARENYIQKFAPVLLAGSLVSESKADEMVESLKEYAITKDKYQNFGYTNFGYVLDISKKAVVNYRSKFAYEMANTPNADPEQIQKVLTSELSGGLLAKLPTAVSGALKEIGSADLYATLVGSIFFKMAGLLLPIIYMIMTANALIAGQVDSGSMAYVLSTGTKRKDVTCTQALYLIGSLFAMFVLTTLCSVICLAIVDVNTGLNYGKLLLINLGAFLVMFAMSGICFLASCVFNRSKRSMALGGGLNMFFLVATMLGLFGSPVLPSIIRMKALNAFNYVSLISLFDVVSIIEGTITFLWKWAILIVVGVACYIAGSIRFDKKDLPL